MGYVMYRYPAVAKVFIKHNSVMKSRSNGAEDGTAVFW